MGGVAEVWTGSLQTPGTAALTEGLVRILGTPELALGAKVGVVLLAVVLVLGAIWRLTGRGSAPIAGAAAAGGIVATWQWDDRVGWRLVISVLLVLVGVWVVKAMRLPSSFAILGCLPGAWLSATGFPSSHPRWSAVIVILGIPILGWCVAVTDEVSQHLALGPGLVAVSLIGIMLTVPDTERALAAVGVMVPIAVAGWPLRLARVGWAGSFAVVVPGVWMVVADGWARGGAVVGGLASFGVLLVYPTAKWLDQPRGSLPDWLRRGRGLPVAAVHVFLVFIASRVAGLQKSAAEAALIAGAVLVVTGAGLLRGRTVEP